MAKTAQSPADNHTIPPSAMPLISPSALLHAHLSQSPPIRVSSRSLNDYRPINLNASSLAHANGSSLIRIGDTSVVCGVRAEILPIHEIANYRANSPLSVTSRTPSNNDQDEDESYSEITSNHLLVPNIELSTGCSPNHIPGGPPSTEAQSLSQRLLSLLHTSKVVRSSDLKIYVTPPPDTEDEDDEDKGPQLRAYWTLYIDLWCIGYGGSIFDAAWLALYAALKDTLLPRAWWDADLGHVLCSPERKEAKALMLRGCPVPLTFGVFVPSKPTKRSEGEHWILCDTDTFEEECCEESGTITVDAGKDGLEIVRVEKSGGSVVGVTELRQLCELAKKRRQEWQSAVSGIFTDAG